ncbi:hypothetical protein M3Y99_01716000 [Aphelenchoides fujianensis]|nr:hypothetical protein M3Y99_01716000 [Aphelenchoides fujianensis]
MLISRHLANDLRVVARRSVFRPPSNIPYAGIYRRDGDVVRKDELLVAQRRLNYHPGANVYHRFDRAQHLLKSDCDGTVRITREKVNLDLAERVVEMATRLPKSPDEIGIQRDIQRIDELITHLTKTGELTSPKLLVLQQILQSKFFHSVREVYENVHQSTGDIDASPEVLASAVAKATVAAFAAAEGYAHPRVIELPKNDQGLGFNVMGGKEQNSPIYVSRHHPGRGGRPTRRLETRRSGGMLRGVCRLKTAKAWARARSFHSDPSALIVTERAAERLKKVAQSGERLRVTVEGGGCAGFENGAAVIVDEISLDFLKGATIDYTEDLMRAAFRITKNPLATQGCSCGASFAPKDLGAEGSSSSGGGGDGGQKQGGGNQSSTAGTKTLLGLSVLATVKDYFGIEEIKLDDDPIKDKVKQAMLYRRHHQYERALNRGEEMGITRIIYEIAITHYLADDLDKADETFRFVIARLIQLHNKTDSSPEFIGLSLKLADIFARRGDLQNAEVGYRHCVAKQMKVMEDHMKKYFISKGALMEEDNKAEHYGPKYTDPLALFGMCLEQFAHFLINYHDERREREAVEYMDEVLKLSYHIYGPSNYHSINLLNNFGAACILRNRFETARKYLEVGIERILHIDECASILVGYYCNYAEALFHCGRTDEALKFAEKAVRLARLEPDRVRNYAERFLKDIRRDQLRTRREQETTRGRESPAERAASSWFGWLGGGKTAESVENPPLQRAATA